LELQIFFKKMFSQRVVSTLLEARRDNVDKTLQTKLFNFLRFTLPGPGSELTSAHCRRVLAWPFWPADLLSAIRLAASCLFEAAPFWFAARVLSSLVCALLLSRNGKHEALVAQIRSGQLRAQLALRELGGGCEAAVKHSLVLLMKVFLNNG